MIIQELLRNCDIDEIMDNWINQYYYEKKGDLSLRENIASSLTKFIDSLLSIQPNYEKSKDWMLLGCKYVEDGKMSITTNLYNMTEIMKKKDTISSFKEVNVEEDKEQFVHIFFETKPQHYDHVFVDWDECMAFHVDVNNIEKYGMTNILSDCLWQLSLLGFDEESRLKERERIVESLKESEEIQKLPEEERKKYYISEEEMKEWLQEKYDVSTEDNEQEREKLLNELYENAHFERDMLLDFIDNLD